MASYRSSRILPTILTIVVIIIVIAGFVALVRLLFSGISSSSSSSQDVNVAQQDLLNTNDGRAVRMTVRGPIVADEDFRSYKITISPSSRQFEAFKGYLDTATNQQTLPNNTAAYDEFVHALDKANLASGKQFEGEKNNTLGICASGKVYEFTLLNGGDTSAMFWTSTCGGSPGSLKGNVSQLSQLFINQIPSGSSIEASLKL